MEKIHTLPANEGVEYSNTNTIFVGMCLDKVLGYHHSKALREMIWDPLWA
jgi:CubicO group peptidase (beta-lactamase class C family)